MGEHGGSPPLYRRSGAVVAGALVLLSLLVPAVIFAVYGFRTALVSLTIPGGVFTFSIVLLLWAYG